LHLSSNKLNGKVNFLKHLPALHDVWLDESLN